MGVLLVAGTAAKRQLRKDLEILLYQFFFPFKPRGQRQ